MRFYSFSNKVSRLFLPLIFLSIVHANNNQKIIADIQQSIEDLEKLRSEPGADKNYIDKAIKDAKKSIQDIKKLSNMTDEQRNTENFSLEKTSNSEKTFDKKLSSTLLQTEFVSHFASQIGNVQGKRIVLHGPKNNGRLWIAKRIAQDMGAHFTSISGYSIGSEKYGFHGKTTLSALFDNVAKVKNKHVVFIDDIEQVAQGGVNSALSFSDELIRFIDKIKNKDVFLIAGTDHFDIIDQNLLKPERLQHAYVIEKPTKEQRLDLLKTIIPNAEESILSSVAHLAHQFGFDEIVELGKMILSKDPKPDAMLIDNIFKEYKKQKFAQNYASLIRDVDGGLAIVKPEQVNTKFKDIIGMEDVIEQLNDILLFIKSPDLFTQKGLTPPKGLILYGPPGNGKTHIVRALAGETNASFISTTGSYFYNSEYKYDASHTNNVGRSKDSVQKIRDVFVLARQLSPCILFIDEFEIIGKARETSSTDGISKVNQFLAEMDGLIQENQGHVFVVVTTNHLDTMDGALLRPGRFDRHIQIGYPKLHEREKLVKGFMKTIKIPYEGSLAPVFDMTAGMSVAYLKNLTNESGLIALREKSDTLKLEHFQKAHQRLQENLSKISPSAHDRATGSDPGFELLMPEQLKDAGFDKIGGCSKEKQQLRDFLTLIKNPEKLNKLGARPVKGVVLYGPPGTGKTMLVRALASEAKLSFINCNGSQFTQGGAGRVRELFKKAREISPTIIFIDEFDVVAKDRNAAGGSGSHDIVNQFLSELDGISPKNDKVFVIITTNNINSLDKALIRPGRFDKHIYVGLPSKEDRIEIIQKLCEKYKILKIDTNRLAEITNELSPAEITNIFNEAAIEATTKQQEAIAQEHIEIVVERLRKK